MYITESKSMYKKAAAKYFMKMLTRQNIPLLPLNTVTKLAAGVDFHNGGRGTVDSGVQNA